MQYEDNLVQNIVVVVEYEEAVNRQRNLRHDSRVRGG